MNNVNNSFLSFLFIPHFIHIHYLLISLSLHFPSIVSSYSSHLFLSPFCLISFYVVSFSYYVYHSITSSLLLHPFIFPANFHSFSPSLFLVLLCFLPFLLPCLFPPFYLFYLPFSILSCFLSFPLLPLPPCPFSPSVFPSSLFYLPPASPSPLFFLPSIGPVGFPRS